MIRLGEITHRPVLSCARGESMAWTWEASGQAACSSSSDLLSFYLHANNNYHIPTNNNTNQQSRHKTIMN